MGLSPRLWGSTLLTSEEGAKKSQRKMESRIGIRESETQQRVQKTYDENTGKSNN